MKRMRASDGTVWPIPGSYEDSIPMGWKLSQAPWSITRSDIAYIGSMLEAFEVLIMTTNKRRNMICRELRKAMESKEKPA